MKLSASGKSKAGASVKRDMELVRDIFRAVIARSDTQAELLRLDDRDPDVVGRHVEMLFNAGYIHGFAPPQQVAKGYQDVFIRDLTWEGHEFAGAILADEGVWQKVKAAFGPQLLATVPLKVVENVALEAVTAWAKAKLNL